MDDQDQGQQPQEDLPLPDASVQDYLKQFVVVLASQTWVRLGLLVNPATGEQETDLEQARLAINVIEYLIDQLEATLSPEAKRELNTLESNLKLNYVERKSAADREPLAQKDSDQAPEGPADA